MSHTQKNGAMHALAEALASSEGDLDTFMGGKNGKAIFVGEYEDYLLHAKQIIHLLEKRKYTIVRFEVGR